MTLELVDLPWRRYIIDFSVYLLRECHSQIFLDSLPSFRDCLSFSPSETVPHSLVPPAALRQDVGRGPSAVYGGVSRRSGSLSGPILIAHRSVTDGISIPDRSGLALRMVPGGGPEPPSVHM